MLNDKVIVSLERTQRMIKRVDNISGIENTGFFRADHTG
jgi:hypothetical protein